MVRKGESSADQPNSECISFYSGSQQVGAKLHRAKGKQPRPSTKVPKSTLSGEGGEVSYTARRLA